MHALQVLFEQRMDRRSREVIDFDLHDELRELNAASNGAGRDSFGGLTRMTLGFTAGSSRLSRARGSKTNPGSTSFLKQSSGSLHAFEWRTLIGFDDERRGRIFAQRGNCLLHDRRLAQSERSAIAGHGERPLSIDAQHESAGPFPRRLSARPNDNER
jgi:hypothetical protein